MKSILELIIIGAKLLASERERYFRGESEKLMREIQDVEDSDFYSKDMEAKGKAERELMTKTQALEFEFKAEARNEGLY